MPAPEIDLPSTPLPPETGPTLSPEDVREFQTIVREETGVDLSDQEAWARATELVAFVRMLIGPLPEDRHD